MYDLAISVLKSVKSFIEIREAVWFANYKLYNQYYGKDELINLHCTKNDDLVCEIDDILDYLDLLINDMNNRNEFYHIREKELYDKYGKKDVNNESL